MVRMRNSLGPRGGAGLEGVTESGASKVGGGDLLCRVARREVPEKVERSGGGWTWLRLSILF
jgi:hypothetical protein